MDAKSTGARRLLAHAYAPSSVRPIRPVRRSEIPGPLFDVGVIGLLLVLALGSVFL